MTSRLPIFSYFFKSNFALPVIIISIIVTVFVISTPSIYMPVYLEQICKVSEKLEDVPAFVRDSPPVKKFEEKYSEYVIDEHIIELTTMPPKLSYQFVVSEGGGKIKLVRINEACVNEDFYIYLVCQNGPEIDYEIHGEAEILRQLDNYDCIDS